MILRLSKLASALTEGSSISSLPGISPDFEVGVDALQKDPVFNGLEGRLRKGSGVGVKPKDIQGPRAYAPRLSKP